jgi:two-component system cell cycle sensor histidine kinase/response regulator CckA
MARKLRILIVEDQPEDAELVLRELRRGGFEPEGVRVDNEEDYLAVLSAEFDLILSDYMMPGFTGLRALELLRHSEFEVPLIIVSGTIGEDTAVAAMKLGATDYVLKDRLTRLPAAVAHALEQARMRSERRVVLGALRESEERLRLLLENAPAAIAMFDCELRYLHSSRRWLTDYGLGDESILGRSHYDVFPEIPERWRRIHQRCLGGAVEKAESDLFVRRDGAHQWLRWEIYPWYASPGQVGGLVMFTEDITARRQAVESLRESEERFRQMTEAINEVFWLTDPAKHEMLYVSPAYERIWGRTCASLYADPLTWLEAIHPEDRERVRDGAVSRQAAGQYDEVYRIVRPDGAIRWIHDRAFPVKDKAGAIHRIVGTAEDITEQRRLEDQIRQAQKMEAIGTLAGGIAHDFNNMLTGIVGYAELARMKLGGLRTGPVHEIDGVLRAARRGTEMVNRIMTFARGRELERVAQPLGPVVNEAGRLLRATIPTTIAIAVELDPAAPVVLADATQVHQVVMNLATNAWQAMRDVAGQLTIRLEGFEHQDPAPDVPPDLPRGRYVRLRIADTGVGMDAATLKRIFEPFFTTKAPGAGTGLGLSVVMGIVRDHGGGIAVESKPGAGSTFSVYFPAHAGAVAVPGEGEGGLFRGRGQHILVVDDEEPLAELGAEMLREIGYVAAVATGPREALELIRAAKRPFDLLITDLTMPDMTGLELARAARGLRPGLPVLLTSGLGTLIAPAELAAAGVAGLLPKPRTLQQLSLAVTRALAR